MTTLEIVKEGIIIGWAGMRGIVSLTVVLALPFSLSNGMPLPGRNIVIFLTFIVIFLTLIIPSLTLPFLVKLLHIQSEEKEPLIKKAREELINIGEKEIHHLHHIQHLNDEEKAILLSYFKTRHQINQIPSLNEGELHAIEAARLRIITAQKNHLLKMWEQQKIGDILLNTLERELDREEIKLIQIQIP